MTLHQLIIRHLGRRDYLPTWQAMRDFTDRRTPETSSELWIVEHPPVFTQGQAGRSEHLLDTGDIPVVQTDRGGQVTYHGPGQLVAYVMLDLRRRGMGVQSLVRLLEQAVIDLLAGFAVTAQRREKAPGVYVEGRKIAALGLRVRRGCSFHGLSLNVDMDLAPFTRINPCGFKDFAVTQLRGFGVADSVEQVGLKLAEILTRNLQNA